MGKSRISKDPNNTKWTSDTSTFGQRILRSHGWQPGEYLGAKDASHSEFHTRANASYIRVQLKEDGGGLGYKPGAVDDDIAALEAVKDIFGRLNGRNDEEERKARELRERKRAMAYLGRRGGGVSFVRGGTLEGHNVVAEEPEEQGKTEEPEETVVAADTSADTANWKRDKKRKSKSADRAEAAEPSKRRKKSRRAEAQPESSAESDSRGKKSHRREKIKLGADPSLVAAEVPLATDDSAADSKARKKERRKESRTDKHGGKAASTPDADPSPSKARKRDKGERKHGRSKPRRAAEPDDTDQGVAQQPASGQSTPGTPTGASTPTEQMFRERRERRIATTSKAMADMTLLKQIFTIG